MLIMVHQLLDDAKCYETIRTLRWPEGVHCPRCGFQWVTTNQPARQRYICHSCEQQFDDLTETPLAGHRQPVKVWILWLYFMGLNLSNQQIAQELELNQADVHEMTTFLRQALHGQRQPPVPEGEVEFDEVYLVAGHKGQPAAVQAAGRTGRRNRLNAKRRRGTLETEKPPVLGMIQRTGQLIIEMLPTVQPKTMMASLRCIPTPLKAFGRSSVLGCVPIAGFLKTSSLFIWLSSRLFTMSVVAVRLYWRRFYPFSLLLAIHIEPKENHSLFCVG